MRFAKLVKTVLTRLSQKETPCFLSKEMCRVLDRVLSQRGANPAVTFDLKEALHSGSKTGLT
jgi:hypothetical protein